MSFIFNYENEEMKIKECKKEIYNEFPNANIKEIKIEKCKITNFFNVESEVTILFEEVVEVRAIEVDYE
jgi:hypothetical protein